VVRELQIAKSTVIKRIGQWSMHLEGRAGGETTAEEDDDGNEAPRAPLS
jgi:hypothetical protein